MTNKSVNIIWRKNNFYSNINELVNNISYEKTINVYNLTDSNIETTADYTVINVEDKIYVNDIIKDIYKKSKEVYDNNLYLCIIDSCILYEGILDFDKDFNQDIYFVQINVKKNSLCLPICYKITDNNLNIDLIYDTELEPTQIICDGNFDELYIDNYYNVENTRNINLLLVEFLLDKYVLDISRNRPKNTLEIHYLHLIKYLKNNDISYLINSFKISDVTYEAFYYLIESVTDSNKSLIQETIIKNINKVPIRGVFQIRDLNKNKIYDYIIQLLIDKKGSRFKIKDIPDWINTDSMDNIYKYYPSLITDTEITEDKISLSDSITYISNDTYNIDTKSLVFSDTNIKIDNITINEHCHTFLYYKNKHILFLNSIDPIKLNIVKDGNLVNIFTYEDNLIDNKYRFVGPIIPFFNRLVSLIKVKDKLYRLCIFESENIKLLGLSKIFRIEKGIPKCIQVNNNSLGIILDIDSKLHIGAIDHVKLFTDICSTLEIDDVFTLEIKDRNNIKLILEGYDNIIDKYEGFVFNRVDEEILYTVNYNPKTRIFNINNKQTYYKDFIYLPNNINKLEKTHDIFFHKSSNDGDFMNKCTELGLTFSDDFRTAKYYIIEHNCFEKLSSIELSKIIENNCLIISLIEDSEINSSNFKKTYTSNEYITKLFLFNIAKNDTYIQFIFDKIIHDNQYEARLQYMEIDKNKMYDGTNIYKTLLSIKEESKGANIVKLCDKGQEIWNNLKTTELYKSYRNNKNVEYLCKYIIDDNFKLDIGYKLENTVENTNNDILKLINKINFMGKTSEIDSDYKNASIFDIIISDTNNILNAMDHFCGPAIIYIIDENILISI